MLSVSLARGSMRMAKKSAIVKNLSSIQNFGSMNILCTDKTGTLTEDRITLVRHIDGNGNDSEEVFSFSYLNSVYQTGIKNPLDQAIQAHGTVDTSAYIKIDEVPFDFTRRRDSLVVEKDGEKVLVTKGAPESILAISSKTKENGEIVPMDDTRLQKTLLLYESLSGDGFRVLAIAAKHLLEDDYVYDAKDESDMIFLGFIAFLDPPKKDAYATIRELGDLGVSMKILTGDSDILTRKICSDIGIEVQGVALGKDIEHLSETALAQLAKKTTIFARVTPEEKARIISALRNVNRDVVGYMGDGINDVVALKAADVGISVENGVPVAKDAADIILLEKSLAALREGIEEGRKTFQNTLKYIMMWLSSNFGNMFSMVGASVFLPFLPMSPQQILLNNFLYDSSQVGLPTDTVDPGDIRRPPRWNIRNIRRFMFIFGPISSIFDFVTFGTLLYVFHLSEKQFQTGWFLESLATQVLVIYLIRTKKIRFFGAAQVCSLSRIPCSCWESVGVWHYLHSDPFSDSNPFRYRFSPQSSVSSSHILDS
jgi:Mg2+-importing ATPase